MDIAVIRAMPEMTVIVPADTIEAARWVPVVAEYDGPVYLRLSRAETIPVHDESVRLQIGRGISLREGTDVTIVATGSMVGQSLRASERLAEKGISARVLEIHTIKPLDLELICNAAAETGAIVTAEEHSVVGGLGGAVAEVLGEHCPVPLVRVGIADTFTQTAFTPELLMDAFGLAVDDVADAAEQVLDRSRK